MPHTRAYVGCRTYNVQQPAYRVPVLHEFLSANRADLADRCRLKVAQRRAPRATDVELEHGIPLFLDQLIRTLQVEQGSAPLQSRRVSGPAGGGGSSEVGKAAARHGFELLEQGFTVDQVVHDYGDCARPSPTSRSSGKRRYRPTNSAP
jgi:hypothetical protein